MTKRDFTPFPKRDNALQIRGLLTPNEKGECIFQGKKSSGKNVIVSSR